MKDLIVVGGGLFGQIAAAWCAAHGASVQVLSDDREGAGSPAAGCVIKPGWLTSAMNRAEFEAAMALLDQLYQLREEKFAVMVAGLRSASATCYLVDPSEVLGGRVEQANVERVGDQGWVELTSGERLEARLVVVATGIWTGELLPWAPRVVPRWGVSFRGPPVEQPRIALWAPYKQVVAFNMQDGGSWLGDGTALKNQLTVERLSECAERCLRLAGLPTDTPLRSTVGARPYLVEKTSHAPCVAMVNGKTMAVTGGGKNGTAAAAWAARRVLEALNG